MSPTTNTPLKMDRAYAMFDALQKGLRDCIALTSSDVQSLKLSIDDGLGNSSSQQYKAAERYLKRLEFQLSKLEELRDQYELHQKMRDGVRSMGYAYALSPGRERESALTSIKIGFKECTETLKKIEAEFESSIGTILIEMKGIQGFARICPGDVFEITLKYGDTQKWKSRGKILKDGSQLWQNQQVIFKALLDEVLSIKAVEVRGLGKNILLGNKLCETRNLFSAHPQLMTVNLNNIGTLKLNLIVTWNPLHGMMSGMTTTAETFSKSKLSLSRSTTSLFGSIRSLPALFAGASLSSKNKTGTLPPQRPTDPFDPNITCHQQPHNFFRSQMKKSHSAIAGVTIKSNTDSSSSGSTPSSLHLTGTSSGFGSGSSYSSHSVPGSALTSPDTESAPIILSNGQIHQPPNFNRNKQHPHQQQMFLSASVTNLHRADSAFVNKKPRPLSQIVEYTPKQMMEYNERVVCDANSSITSQYQYQQQSMEQHHSYYLPNNMSYTPNTSQYIRGRFIDRKSYHDIIEAADEENTDCSSELTDCSPVKSPETRSSSDDPFEEEEQDRRRGIPQESPSISRGQKPPKDILLVSSQEDLLDQTKNRQQKLLNQSSRSINSTTNAFYVNLSEALINLISSLEDIQGQYTETQILQQNVQCLFKVIKQMSQYLAKNKSSSLRQRANRSLLENNNSKSMYHLCNINGNGHTRQNCSKTSTPRKLSARSRRGSGTSDFSLAVESALQSFDFLNTAISDNDSSTYTPEHLRSSFDRSRSKSTDALHFHHHVSNNNNNKNNGTNGMIGSRVISDDETVTSFMSPREEPLSPVVFTPTHVPFSTGSTQLDTVIVWHLYYCQRLLENLGSFGPLKQRESQSLDKLSGQATILGKLQRLCINLKELNKESCQLKTGNEVDILQFQAVNEYFKQKQDRELSFLREEIRTRKIWDTITYQNSSISDLGTDIGSHLLCVPSKQFCRSIESYINSFVTPSTSKDAINVSPMRTGTLGRRNTQQEMARKVARLMTCRVLDSGSDFDSESVVTVFQLNHFFEQETQNLEQLFKSFTEEVTLMESLTSGDAIEVKQSLNRFKRSLPPREALYQTSLLLLDRDALIVRIAETFFLESHKNKSTRNALIALFVEGLEEDSPLIRQSACLVLMLLNGKETMDQLLYVSYADTNSGVREQAKHALFSLGDNGRKMYESSQLFAHGFQGLSVK